MNRSDFLALTKARLSLLVVVTTFFGYWLASKSGEFNGWRLIHTLIGTVAAAFASSIFNQLMEVEADRKMRRTENRPLPANRIPVPLAFAIGFLLAAFGVIHLAQTVNSMAALLTGITLGLYIFVYTPMKQRSSWNTIVGAVAGAIPPAIGWFAADGKFGPEVCYLFGLLFLWQLPHFLAINWMYREEYIRGGFVMWSNDDETGLKTANLALIFSVCLVALMAMPFAFAFGSLLGLIVGLILAGVLVVLAMRFRSQRNRESARTMFFYTLIYLPLILE